MTQPEPTIPKKFDSEKTKAALNVRAQKTYDFMVHKLQTQKEEQSSEDTKEEKPKKSILTSSPSSPSKKIFSVNLPTDSWDDTDDEKPEYRVEFHTVRKTGKKKIAGTIW